MKKIGGLAAAALLLAACGADSGGTTTAVPAVATTVAIPDPGITPIEIAPCELLTAEEVADATGYPVTGVRDEPPISCVFDLDTGGNVFVFVSIEDGMGRFSGAANLFEQYTLLIGDGETEAVDDLGEGAVCCPFRTMAVDAGGGRFVAVGVSGSFDALAEPLEALNTLAEAILARL
ncbi:MAG: DUF3558 domain-containing protein [Acidimicrobiia bacterium]|nr:DUF3558 domain-containing protein [Acidimicrobiia bacterium]